MQVEIFIYTDVYLRVQQSQRLSNTNNHYINPYCAKLNLLSEYSMNEQIQHCKPVNTHIIEEVLHLTVPKW